MLNRHGPEFYGDVASKCALEDVAAPTVEEKSRIADWFSIVQSVKSDFHKELRQLWAGAYDGEPWPTGRASWETRLRLLKLYFIMTDRYGNAEGQSADGYVQATATLVVPTIGPHNAPPVDTGKDFSVSKCAARGFVCDIACDISSAAQLPGYA